MMDGEPKYCFVFLFFGFLVFGCFLFFCSLEVGSLRHLQAAHLARAGGGRQDAPGRARTECREQRRRDRVLLTVGHHLAEELHAVDGGARRGVRHTVPDHREVLLDVVEARQDGQARGLGLRSHGGLLGRSSGHDPLIHAVILRNGLCRRRDLRQDNIRTEGLVLADEVHTDDRDLPVGSRVLDGPVLGRLEGLEEEMGRDDVVVHPLIKVPRARLAPLLVVLAVPHNSVALRTVRAGAQRDKGHREVLPDVLALVERGNVVFPAELHVAHGLVVRRSRGLLHLCGGGHVVHTKITPADGMRCHQRVEVVHRQIVVVGDGSHSERKEGKANS
jgi:hypothetical protein